ncbi:MAG: TetR/AcrR family transcriptional regulator, partial [Eubacterium sp.]|nr:TetR/AcrR family transcriptional regulator [Eubacterium sp.]
LIVDNILERMKKDPNLLRFITKNLSWGVFHSMVMGEDDGEKMTFYDEYHDMLDKSGRKFRNPDLLLYMVVELISGCSYQVILEGQPVSLDELKPDLFQAIRDMIANQEIK